MERSQLWRATTIYYELHGSCFWVLLNDQNQPIKSVGEVPAMMIPCGPDTVIPRFSKQDENKGTRDLLGWTWVINKSKSEQWSNVVIMIIR